MAIIDTHIHIWDFSKADYPWLQGNTTILNRNYHLLELEPERLEAGVTNGILVQAANNEEDTNWMLSVAAQTDWISGVVGWLPLENPQKTAAQITLRKANPFFKGVRHLIHDEQDSQWLLQPQVLESLQILAEHQLPYDVVGVLPQHLEVAIQVAKKIPSLQLMLDHLNQPRFNNKNDWEIWCSLMKEAAELPNVYTKISGLGTTIGKENWNASDISPALHFVLEQFGPERCCLGGDWPVSLLAGSYFYTWQQYHLALTRLNHKDSLENVFFTTAKQFYNL